VNGNVAARSGEWAQHFSNASCCISVRAFKRTAMRELDRQLKVFFSHRIRRRAERYATARHCSRRHASPSSRQIRRRTAPCRAVPRRIRCERTCATRKRHQNLSACPMTWRSNSCTIKISYISTAILWRVFHVLTEPYMGPWLHYSVDLRVQTYTEPVPLNNGKSATKYPCIALYGYFFTVWHTRRHGTKQLRQCHRRVCDKSQTP